MFPEIVRTTELYGIKKKTQHLDQELSGTVVRRKNDEM